MLIIYLRVVRAEYYIHRAHLIAQKMKMRWMFSEMLGDRGTVVYEAQYTCQ